MTWSRTQVTSNARFVFAEGPWPGLAAPPGSTRIWQHGARVWILRMHDDPHDFKPVFVESVERPYVNAPCVTLGYYSFTGAGWVWVETPLEEL